MEHECKGTVHRVVAGDTLYKLSKMYGVRLIDILKERVHGLSGVIHNINPKRTNVVLGREFRTLWGSGVIVDSIGNVRFKISPVSFYQVNSRQTRVLYDKVLEFVELYSKRQGCKN